MENQKDDILMKVRSSRGCIGAGYRLYTGNFKRIFRYSWVAALVYALVCSVGGTLMVFRPQAFPITVTIILVAEALFTSYGFAVLKKHQETGSIPMTNKWFSIDTHIFIRTLKAWLCLIVIYLFVALVIGGSGFAAFKFLSPYTALGGIALISLIVILLLLPLIYIVTRYILTEGTGFWRQLSAGYPVGMRHWGFIFTVAFVVTLVQLGLSLITSLPATILSVANIRSTQSLMLGDPYGMPSYIGWLAAVTFLLIGFIQAYVQLSALFPVYYMYGSIDEQEQEKQNFNKNKLSI